MTPPAAIERCSGKEVPFGSTYDHPECQWCARSQLLAYSKHTVWIGPMKFEGKCPSKLRSEE